MDFVLDGYCGVFCGACPILLVTREGSIAEEKQCFGCKSQKPGGYCAICGIKACAIQKGFEFCNECSEMNTCKLMQAFISDQQYPYGKCVLNNMEEIRISGLPSWLEKQNKRWRCEHCSEPYSWYQETCSQCGRSVKNYLADL